MPTTLRFPFEPAPPPPDDPLGASALPARPPTTRPPTAPPMPASSDRRVTSRWVNDSPATWTSSLSLSCTDVILGCRIDDDAGPSLHLVVDRDGGAASGRGLVDREAD